MTTSTPTQASASKGIPQYRVVAPTYLNDILYDQGKIDAAGDDGLLIYWKGPPNAALVPVNDAARVMCEKYPMPALTPEEAIGKVSADPPAGAPPTVEALVKALTAALATAKA